MTAAANVGHAWNVNSASGICKISAKQMLDQESIFFFATNHGVWTPKLGYQWVMISNPVEVRVLITELHYVG